MNISEQIKTMCKYLGVSVSALADRLFISNPTLYEKVKKETFTPAKLAELARAAGCGYESVFTLQNGRRIICAVDAATGELTPTTADQIVELCKACEVSKAELAKALDVSPQSFQNRLGRDTFRPRDLKAIAAAVDCTYTSAFIMPNGDRITY